MINDKKNNTLDETIKQSLSNYEMPFDSSDWEKMEHTLDAAPKGNNFKWSYLISAFVALAVLSSGYLLYTNWSSFKSTTPASTEPVEKTISPVVKTNPAPIPPPAIKPQPLPETKIETPLINDEESDKTKESEDITIEKKNKDEKSLAEKTKKKKTKEDGSKEKEGNKQIIIMGNEPVFGDMLDSTKGIIRVTKEKEETKQAAKKPTEYPIGWNNFMLSNVNPDSIRHYRESMKKDSLKQ